MAAFAAWQFPDGMQMIRQQDDGNDFKRMIAFHLVNRFPHTSSTELGGQNGSTLVCHKREEENRPFS